MSRATPFLLLAALTAATACSERAVTSVDLVPASITKVAGDSQTATVQSAVPVQPAVLVENAHHQPVAGVKVALTVASGGGSIVDANPTTNSLGIAKVTWRLGKTAGANALVARAEGVNPVTFTATGTAGPAAKLSRVDASGLTATVGAAIAAPPGVRVTDACDNPVAGVGVSFTVASGGGSIAYADPTTDSLGGAKVAWVLGKSAGTNTLVARVEGVDSVTFTATGTAGPAAKLSRADPSNLSATVGAAIAAPPGVRVTDAYDNPIAGVAVSFTVSAGGGSATDTAAVTDSLGVARVGSWTLGTVAGPNALAATVSGLSPLTIPATALAGPPASLAMLAGDAQTGGLSSAVDTAPVVLVSDAYGNPAPGIQVTYTVTSGGGSVGLAAAVTNLAGVATAGRWTLGPAPGTNTLVASVAGLPAVTFSAVAVDRCAQATSYSIGSTVDGALSTSDCRLPSGEYTDLYSVTVPTASSVRFDMTSNAYSPRPSLFDGTGALVVPGPFLCYNGYYCSATSVRALLPMGDYVVAASGYTYDYDDNTVFGVVGPYSFSSTMTPEDVTGCEDVFITRGVTTSQRIDTTDCEGTFRGSTYFYDQFSIYVTAGQTCTITMSSTEFDTYLEVAGVASNDDFGGTTDSQITFTPTYSGLYAIRAGTYKGGATGSYTLVVQ